MKQGSLVRMQIRLRIHQSMSTVTATQMRKNPALVVGVERWLFEVMKR